MFVWLGSYPHCAAEPELDCSIQEVSKTLMSMDKQIAYVLEITDQCLCCESIVRPKTTMHAPKQTVRSGAPDTTSYEMNFKFKD